VQTGPHATATINLTPTNVETLRTAITQVHLAGQQATDLPEEVREEVAAVALDVRNELQQPVPNRLRVAQLAMGVATAIQAVGSLQPAYVALKAGLAAIGIPVPYAPSPRTRAV
jgi:hypothetical protein